MGIPLLNQCCSLERGEQGHFPRAHCDTAAAHAVPTPARGTSSSIHPFPRGDGGGGQQDPHAGLGGHIPALAIPFCSPGCSTFPGSWRRCCSSCFPTWSCCQTSHCELLPEAELVPLVSQTVPTPCGCQQSQTPGTGPGLQTVVHLMSIYDGLCNVFPRFDLTHYKLKPFCVWEEGGAAPSLLTNPL